MEAPVETVNKRTEVTGSVFGFLNSSLIIEWAIMAGCLSFLIGALVTFASRKKSGAALFICLHLFGT